ncbi:hypothetical protein Pcinc_011515 [Petrolisthes cinctipes]|uniref:Ionotropic glutamate receptor C-terminal domain-containing protein n=1 Tax=Petrolisthes cinctipes TaxID=88211 RepID=A0AAE1G2R3_PETCI|nr:hypothetical protein Pcinc_011515 [Petrolisthes cinctipes]
MLLGNLRGLSDPGRGELWDVGGDAVSSVLEQSGLSSCSLTIYSDSDTTSAHISMVRQRSWCNVVVVVSESRTFLATLANWSLKGRLLVWATRLLVVTRLTLPHLHSLLSSHWTFSMMNTVFLNLEQPRPNLRMVAYTCMPYSEDRSQVIRLASWTSTRGFRLLSHYTLFPEKFTDFHGALVNVTALPFMPFWGEVEGRSDDGGSIMYTGSDYHLLVTVARALNFTFQVIPTTSWAQVTQRVQERVAFMCPIYHILMSVRQEQYDFTFTYEYAYFSFSMARPGIGARWKSLYYPFSGQVWIMVLVLVLLSPFALYLVQLGRGHQYLSSSDGMGVSVVMQDMTGMLLGQNLPSRLPVTTSSRVLVAAWLVFALILGLAYRGNLTASLTIPKFPPRPETLEQLVDAVDRITIGGYGEAFRRFYSQSDSEVFRKLATLMDVGPSIMQGLTEATERKQAHLGGKRYQQQTIAAKFTAADGSSRLYLGRESIFPGPSGWPIPHDAPYKHSLDSWIMVVLQAGLYEKWVGDMLQQTKMESMRRQQQHYPSDQQQVQQHDDSEWAETSEGSSTLTILHLQGLFLLLLIGLGVASCILIVEIIAVKVIMRRRPYTSEK